jgi:hypothetical protein
MRALAAPSFQEDSASADCDAGAARPRDKPSDKAKVAQRARKGVLRFMTTFSEKDGG